jgi:hypothetical protein
MSSRAKLSRAIIFFFGGLYIHVGIIIYVYMQTFLLKLKKTQLTPSFTPILLRTSLCVINTLVIRIIAAINNRANENKA